MTLAIPRGIIYHRIRDDVAALAQAVGGPLDDAGVIADFEAAFASYVGRAGCVSFPSARTAILSALRIRNFAPGSEIVMPPITIKPILDVVLACGLVPIFVDLDPDTLCFDLDKLETAITPNTRSILVTYLFGLVPDMDRLMNICRAHDLFVMEDFSQCLNGAFRGKKIGSFGDVSVYSSSFIKTLDTYGGGQLVSDDRSLMEQIRAQRDSMPPPSRAIVLRKILFDLAMNLATTRWIFAVAVFPLLRILSRLQPAKVIRHLGLQSVVLLPSLPAAWFHRYSSVQAALGLRLLPGVAAGDARRREHVARLKALVGNTPLRFPRGVPEGTNVFWQCIVPVRDAPSAQRALHAHGVDTSTTSLTHIAELPHSPFVADTPCARAIHQHGLFIPTYPDLADEDIEHIARALSKTMTEQSA
jgi:dTDP-4-amino-4,6-dideoxygalactose transaminase